MLGSKRLRQLLPEELSENISDADLESLHQQLRAFAELAWDSFRASGPSTLVHHERVKERAAIMEFDGGMNRHEAEFKAILIEIRRAKGRIE